MIAEGPGQVSEDKRRLEILLGISKALSEEIHLDRLLTVMIADTSAALA